MWAVSCVCVCVCVCMDPLSVAGAARDGQSTACHCIGCVLCMVRHHWLATTAPPVVFFDDFCSLLGLALLWTGEIECVYFDRGPVMISVSEISMHDGVCDRRAHTSIEQAYTSCLFDMCIGPNGEFTYYTEIQSNFTLLLRYGVWRLREEV